MWTRRFVSAVTAVALAGIGAMLGVSGPGIYLFEIVAVPVAMVTGIVLGSRIHMHRRGHAR